MDHVKDPFHELKFALIRAFRLEFLVSIAFSSFDGGRKA